MESKNNEQKVENKIITQNVKKDGTINNISQLQPIETTTTGGNQSKIVFNTAIADIVGVFLWIYTITKLFIFDIDNYFLVKAIPDYSWLIYFKFFFYVTVGSLLLIILKKSLVWWVVYVLFFPLILLFWKLPRLIWKSKSWVLLFSILNFGLSLFKDFRFNFITKSLALVSGMLVIFSDSKLILTVSALYLIVYLATIFYRSIYNSFTPSQIFKLQSKLINWIRTSKMGQQMMCIDKKLKQKPLNKLNSEQKTQLTTNLQSAVVFNRFCYYFAYKLNQFKDRKTINLSFNLWTYLSIFFQSSIVFSLLNLALYKVDNTSINLVSGKPSFFYFFYYSISELLPGGTPTIYPISQVAIVLKMIMNTMGFLFYPVILLNFIYSIRDYKFKQEIEDAVESIKQEGMAMDKFISDEYQLTISEAIKKLTEAKAGMVNFIYRMSSQIPEELQTTLTPPTSLSGRKKPHRRS